MWPSSLGLLPDCPLFICYAHFAVLVNVMGRCNDAEDLTSFNSWITSELVNCLTLQPQLRQLKNKTHHILPPLLNGQRRMINYHCINWWRVNTAERLEDRTSQPTSPTQCRGRMQPNDKLPLLVVVTLRDYAWLRQWYITHQLPLTPRAWVMVRGRCGDGQTYHGETRWDQMTIWPPE